MSDGPHGYTFAKAARLVGISLDTESRQVRSGEFGSAEAGGRTLVDQEDIEAARVLLSSLQALDGRKAHAAPSPSGAELAPTPTCGCANSGA